MITFWRLIACPLLFIGAVYCGSIAISATQHGSRLLWLFPAAIGVCALVGCVLVWVGGSHDPY